MSPLDSSQIYGPWNPGILSQLPSQYLPLSTMFRTENVSTSLQTALEWSDFCGLSPQELVEFRFERLIVHELLVRIMADLFIPDGPNDEDLGINFREMASTILIKYLNPQQKEFERHFEKLKLEARACIERLLSSALSGVVESAADSNRVSVFKLLSFRKLARSSAKLSPPTFDHTTISQWQQKADRTNDPLEASCLDSLVKITTAILRRRGQPMGDFELLKSLASTLVCNSYGSDIIGKVIEPYIKTAAMREGYTLLPVQIKPVVMNVKGASASGKSTMRPLQRALAGKLNISWNDFAVISPDIWRKFLLDYNSLGTAYKYAGTLTGHELEIIDKKLDHYMAAKAASGKMSHLLIDRFRFDSFVPESEDESSKLLTRFGELIYLYFMITPPDATVERAWKRGLKIGRYKAVDDLLDHNVEAFTGMPQLFFTWALRTKKRVHYEFLDNSVPEGHRPRTVAFGWNGEMNILDICCMLDVDRFRNINVDASSPEAVYKTKNREIVHKSGFLEQCAQLIPIVNFADYDTGEVYAILQQGEWIWRDEKRFSRSIGSNENKLCLDVMGLLECRQNMAYLPRSKILDVHDAHTLGVWGIAQMRNSQ